MNLPRLDIIYGSATGNAEHIAKDLAARAQEKLNQGTAGWFGSVYCGECDSFKKSCWTGWTTSSSDGVKKPIIVVCSTTGNGEAPENADRLTRQLKRKPTIEAKPLTSVVISVLGLGDTNYEKFCGAARNIDKYMADCGAERLQPLVAADEATGLEDVVEPYKDGIFDKFAQYYQPSDQNKTIFCDEEKQIIETPDVIKDTDTTKQLSVVQQTLVDLKLDDASQGVKLVHKVAQQNNITIPLVPNDPSSLPSVGAPRCICKIVSSPCDVNECSNEDAPFFYCTLLSARYLTNTTPAVKAAQLLQTNNTSSINNDDDEEKKEDSKLAKSILQLHQLNNAMKAISDAFDPQDKRVLELVFEWPSIQYQPGDAVGMILPNKPYHVLTVLDKLQKHYSVVHSQTVEIMNGSHNNIVVSVMDAIKLHMDLNAILKPRTLVGLAAFCTDSHEQHLLQHLACDKELYKHVVLDNHLNCGDLLEMFDSCCPTLDALLALLPPLAPRYYSICSSPLSSPNQIKLALSAVDYNRLHLPRNHGLATSYLETLATPLLCAGQLQFYSAEKVKISLIHKPSSDFSLPENLNTPMVLIGPGTGIAPFMGFLEHRAQQQQTCNPTAIGSIDLFFGCRSPILDHLYENELEQYMQAKVLTNLYTAFSRHDVDDVNFSSKRYVQDLMRAPNVAQRLRDLVTNHHASIYICGDGNAMAKDVQAVLKEILSCDLQHLKDSNRLLLDIWM